MLEAKIVTANGDIVIASEFQNEDLFYAMRGGGHGFGVVVSLTVRTHPLPQNFGITMGQIKANSKQSGDDLVKHFLEFYKQNLMGPDWGEQVGIYPEGNGLRMEISLMAVDFTHEEMVESWKPFKDWVQERPNDFTIPEFNLMSVPAKMMWDVQAMEDIGFGAFATRTPYDPKEPQRGFFWSQNRNEISQYWMEYVSRFLRVDHFLDNVQHGTEILMKFVRSAGGAGLHLNKAQFGASEWARNELEKTPMHPSVKNSFGLMILATGVQHYSPLVSNSLQSNTSSINEWQKVCNSDNIEDCDLTWFYDALNEFRRDTPGAGAYFNEADYHENDWQENFWGLDNYQRLLEIKLKWDPDHLFYCHKCVGSEFYEEGGMCRTDF